MITRWNPFNEFFRLDRDFNFSAIGWSPSIDISEDKEKILVEAELPGLDIKDIELSIHSNQLTIKGKKIVDKKENKREYLRTERAQGSFARSFALPSGLDEDGVSASFDKGILVILIPKRTQEQIPKRIKINGSQ